MTETPNEQADRLIVVHSAKDEIEASLVVSALKEAGVHASMQGQHTGSFRAENWSDVLVVTRQQDFEAAKRIIDSMKPTADINWDEVDVGEPLD